MLDNTVVSNPEINTLAVLSVILYNLLTLYTSVIGFKSYDEVVLV
jgi:hypothetical protein